MAQSFFKELRDYVRGLFAMFIFTVISLVSLFGPWFINAQFITNRRIPYMDEYYEGPPPPEQGLGFFTMVGISFVTFSIGALLARALIRQILGNGSEVTDTPTKPLLKRASKPSSIYGILFILILTLLPVVVSYFFFLPNTMLGVVITKSGNFSHLRSDDWYPAYWTAGASCVSGIIGLLIVVNSRRSSKQEIQPIPTSTSSPARQQAQKPFNLTETAFNWLGFPVSYEQLRAGFLILGSIGSGKTSVIKNLLSKLSTLANKNKSAQGQRIGRIIVFSPRNDLAEYPLTRHQYYVGMDKRTISYNISNDISDYAGATQLAHHLRLTGRGSNEEFWERMVQKVVTEAISKLQEIAKGKWTLRQLLALLSNQKLLAAFLGHYPDTAYIVETCLGNGADNKLGQSVHASIIAAVMGLSPVASIMENANGKKLSMKEFLQMEDVTLVLSWEERHGASLGNFHAMLLEILIDNILREKRDDLTVICIDEYSLLKYVGGFERLAARSREEGAVLILANQTVEALFDKAGNENRTNAQLGNLMTLVALQNESAQTREWISKRAGKIQVIREIEGNDAKQCLDVPVIPEEDIRTLPHADYKANKVSGIYSCPWAPKRVSPFTAGFIVSHDNQSPESRYEAPPPEWQRLQRFTIEDAEALNFPKDPAILAAIPR